MRMRLARETEQTVRQTLARRDAWRRDHLFAALRIEPETLDAIVRLMIGRGEVETLRPIYARTHHDYFYRLRRESDNRYQVQVAPRKPLPHARMADAYHMGLA